MSAPAEEHPRFQGPEPALPRAVAEALLELFVCDAEIERRSQRLAALRARLAAAPPSPEAALRSEVETAIGCLLDHLRPASEVMKNVETLGRTLRQVGEIQISAREQAIHEAYDHGFYQLFFAGIEERTVMALRHLVSCPVCERMTRILLLGFLAPGSSYIDWRAVLADMIQGYRPEGAP